MNYVDENLSSRSGIEISKTVWRLNRVTLLLADSVIEPKIVISLGMNAIFDLAEKEP